MNLGKVEIWETSLDRIVTLREGAKGVLRQDSNLVVLGLECNDRIGILYELVTGLEPWEPWERRPDGGG